MSDNELERIEAIFDKWNRSDYTSRIRTTPSGVPTIEVPIAIREKNLIEPGAVVEWKQLEDGTLTLIIEPPAKYDLDELVAGITPENRHEYIDTGNPMGNEVW